MFPCHLPPTTRRVVSETRVTRPPNRRHRLTAGSHDFTDKKDTHYTSQDPGGRYARQAMAWPSGQVPDEEVAAGRPWTRPVTKHGTI
jgi:hypothetical protein